VPAVVGDGIRAQTRSVSFVPAASRSAGTVTRCLPARHENVLQALLCTTMWIACVKRRRACAHIGKCWGLCCRGRARNRAFTWESAIHALWTEKKAKLSTRHAAIAHK
jgi:hypothetical protein